MSIKNIIILLAILLILGGLYYYLNRPEPPPPKEPVYYVWLFEMEELEHIKIELPSEKLSQSFIKISKGDQFPWFFDDSEHSDIDRDRWGGGIPLILSGPQVARIITENATDEQLALYGLIEPSIVITLTLEDGSTLHIKVGDKTPDYNNFYVQAPNRRSVATVDVSWYTVIERLVKDPPYAPLPEE